MAFSDAHQCEAHAKATGSRCKNPAVKGHRVCRLHGAGNPGKGKPGGRPIRTGRYSRWLPTQLAQTIADAAAHGRLLELDDEISLVRGRIAQLLTLIAQPPPDWQAAKDALADLDQAVRNGDTTAFQAARSNLGAVIDAGERDAKLWDEVMRLLDLLRRMVGEHGKLLVLASEILTKQQALVLLARLEDIVRKHVSDPAEVSAIGHALRQLTVVESGGSADGAT